MALAYLCLLFLQVRSKTYNATLESLDVNNEKIESTFVYFQDWEPFEITLFLETRAAFVRLTVQEQNTNCAWYLRRYELDEPRKVTGSLSACDYPLRDINKKRMSLTMPLDTIEDFQTTLELTLKCEV